MAKIEDLYELIHSFSKSEKRSFRRRAGSYEGSQLLELFELLNRQPRFAQVEVAAELEQSGLARNLPTLMRRLRRALLNSQRSLYSHHSTESRLQYMLEEVQYLYRRNLSRQALEAIHKAKKLALKFSRAQIALQLNFYQRQILLDLQQKGKPYEKIRREEEELLALSGLQLRLEDLQVRARAQTREGFTGEREVNQFLSGPDIEAGLNSDDFLCRLYALYARGIALYGLKKYPAARDDFGELMQLWQQHPEWINEKPRLFLGTFTNYQSCLMLTASRDGFAELESLHALFGDFRFREPDVQTQYERGSYQTRLLLLLNQLRFEEGAELVNELTGWLKQKEGQLPLSTVLALRYNLFVFYFLQEKWSEANRVARAIGQMEGSEERKDIRELMRLAEVILQYELGHWDLVENLLRSARRYFMKRSKLPPQIPVVLEFFRSGLQEGQRGSFEGLRVRLSELAASGEGSFLGQMELLLWAQARATGESVTALARKLVEG